MILIPVAHQSTGPRFEPGTNLEEGRYNIATPHLCMPPRQPRKGTYKPLLAACFSWGGLCYHVIVESYVYHVVSKIILWSNATMWSKYKHEEAHVIMWYQLLSCGTKCYHVVQKVIMWDQMLSCGTKCYHLGPNAIMWDQMLS